MSTARSAPSKRSKRKNSSYPDLSKVGSPSVEAFEPIAQLIAPDPPMWLKEHLRRWRSSILSTYAVETRQPSRKYMRKMLTDVEEAASLLIRVLGASALVKFLDVGADQPLPAPGNLRAMLVDLRDRAKTASGSPALVNSEGRTRAGKGRASPKATISAQTYCALLIAETWKHFRGDYPSPRNKQAAEAVDIYWRLSGGERQSWGNDKLIAWRRHFHEAGKFRSDEASTLRAEYRRHLPECAAQARALGAEDASGDGP